MIAEWILSKPVPTAQPGPFHNDRCVRFPDRTCLSELSVPLRPLTNRRKW